jgi:monovalent cation:proton antiporter-2 (CPA2) family protein
VDFFFQAAYFLGAATIIVPIFRRLGFGDVLGYLGAGLIIGPWGIGLVENPDSVMHFAEVGVVFLLFIIGLELQPSRLWAFRRLLFGLGSLQVVITTAAIAVVARTAGQEWTAAIVIGCALSLSSTAFVLQLMAERKELLMSHGRAAFAVLLFQDIAVVPMLALTSAFSTGDAMAADVNALLEFGRVTLILVAFIVVGRYTLRPIFRFIANAGGGDVFTAAALLLVLGSGLLLQSVGLSMGLGAFLAGVLVADSEFRHQLEADILPFKGLLLGLFFMAVGMSANFGLLLSEPLLILAATGGLMLGKWVILYPLGRAFGLKGAAPRRMALVLCQGGEFAFVILAAALTGDLVNQNIYDFLVLVVTISMVMTPVVVTIEARVRERTTKDTDDRPYDKIEDDEPHVVVAGFGRFGQVVARVLTAQGIPYTALDASPTQIDFVSRFGNKVYFGDASQLHLLHAAKTADAKLFVLAIADMEASVKIAEQVAEHFPSVKIYARARNRVHALALRELGCEIIMRDTLLSSLYVAEQVLLGLGFEQADAKRVIDVFTRHDEETLDQQFAVRDDEDALVQTAVDSAAELKFLFEADTSR